MGNGARGIAALAIVLALAGCSSATGALPKHSTTATQTPVVAPSPTPTGPPALSQLVLSPNGLGPLVIGSPVPDEPPTTAVVLWNPTACGQTGAWLPNYPDGPLGPNGDPTGRPFYFAVDHKTDALQYINVTSTQIKTSAGISIGSTRQQVVAAYPHFDAIVAGPVTDLYEINGPKAKLVIEVERTNGDPGYANRVALMEVNGLGSAPGSLYGNDAGGGICPGP